MGLVWIDAVIRSPSTGRAVAVKALVDTGATLSVVPRRIADELQLPVIGRRRAATAKGVAELDECIGIVEVMGRKAYTHARIRRHRRSAHRCGNPRNPRPRSRPGHEEAKGGHDVFTLNQGAQDKHRGDDISFHKVLIWCIVRR